MIPSRHRSISWQWSALLLLLLLPSTSRSQVRALDLREMVGAAGMIYVGTVTDVHGGRDEHGDIVTYTTFSVEQAVRGVSGTSITVKQFGGQFGGLSTTIAHMRYFQRGERVLVMFYPVSDLGFTSPVGLEQGVWKIGSDNRVHGIRPEILRGLTAEMKRNQLTLTSGSAARIPFIAVINDLLAPSKSQKKGGSNR
jgi:hypothetical protein